MKQNDFLPSINDLELLFVNNEDLTKIITSLGRFNPIQVMRMENQEIRHSNILAWLLNPKESHGLDDKFLKAGQRGDHVALGVGIAAGGDHLAHPGGTDDLTKLHGREVPALVVEPGAHGGINEPMRATDVEDRVSRGGLGLRRVDLEAPRYVPHQRRYALPSSALPGDIECTSKTSLPGRGLSGGLA